jgi:hypothetical protein
MTTEPDDFLDKLFADYEVILAKRKLRKERPWTFDIIRVLWGHRAASGMRIENLVRELWHIREPSGLNMPKAFGNTVQSTVNQHTSQSSEWQKKGAKAGDDLFFSPRGKRSGTWAVHKERALEWVKTHELPEL